MLFFHHRKPKMTDLLLAAAITLYPAGAALAAPGHNHADDPRPTAPTARKPAPAAAAKPVKLPPGVVAQVNGQNITRAQVLATLNDLGGQPLLNQMVQAAVLEQEAKRLGVTVTEAEIKREIEAQKQNIVTGLMQSGTPMTYGEFASQRGVSPGLLRYSARQRLLAQKAYKKHIEKSVAAPKLEGMIQASHILVATVPLPQAPGAPEVKPPSEDEAKKKIEAIRADIKGGKKAFDAAARESSDDKGSGAQGGSLGWFGKGMMDPAFEQAAFALKNPGDVSDPIKSQFGWHIIRLDQSGAKATAAQKEQMRQQEINQRLNTPNAVQMWLSQLAQGAKIATNTAAMTAAGGAGSTATAPAKRAPAPKVGQR